MRKTVAFILLGVIFLSCQNETNSNTSKNHVLNINEELKTLRFLKEVEWPQAYREQDTVLLDRILGDDF